jgi:hypothetical protein
MTSPPPSPWPLLYSHSTINFQFWPVSAPVNTPTLLTVNMTSDSTTNYKFDLSGNSFPPFPFSLIFIIIVGKTSYACVWQYTVDGAAFTIPNIGGLFSVFTPKSSNMGTCMSPALGNVTSNGSEAPEGMLEAQKEEGGGGDGRMSGDN